MTTDTIVDEFWIDYKNLLKKIHRNLPTLPVIVSELTNILENPDSSTHQVEDVMVSDQTIASRVLRIANTTYYRGNRDKVTDANDAIGMLGFDKIKDVILTTSVFKVFAGEKTAEQRFSLEGLWKHSLGVASAARVIAKSLGKNWPETAYTCGLLHDIGKVARFKLDEDQITNQFLADSQFALDKKVSFFRSELSNHSPRHDYLGYLICKQWGLSSIVEAVVRWHHEPDTSKRQRVRPDSDAAELIDLVMVSDFIVHQLGFGFSGHESPDNLPQSLWTRLGLDEQSWIVAEVERELELTQDFCSMLEAA